MNSLKILIKLLNYSFHSIGVQLRNISSYKNEDTYITVNWETFVCTETTKQYKTMKTPQRTRPDIIPPRYLDRTLSVSKIPRLRSCHISIYGESRDGTFFLVFRTVQGYQMFFGHALSWLVPSYWFWRPKDQSCIASRRNRYDGYINWLKWKRQRFFIFFYLKKLVVLLP